MGYDAPIRYSLLDPTGNITALVESAVDADARPAVAAAVMRRHPEAEQLGFLRRTPGADVHAALQMAGGEFCGNASMCAAALLFLDAPAAYPAADDGSVSVLLRVSGARDAVEVRLRPEGADAFRAAVRMPPALHIGETALAFGRQRAPLPLVQMEGISHLILTPDCAFFSLLRDPEAAGQAVRDWCAALGADCLGLMFLEGGVDALRLTPLVYVPGSGTLFWENSCASGSAAVGMLLASRRGTAVELHLAEPGGCLRVKSDPVSGETRLLGGLRLSGRHTL